MFEVNIRKKLPQLDMNIAFSLKKGVLAILGTSGCGKTMTLKCIAGITNPDSGYISNNGIYLYNSEKKISLNPHKRKIGYVFQNYALFPHMTVYQNISYGLGLFNSSKNHSAVSDIINRVRLNGLEKRYPHQLSGGQQQRCALARTLVTDPEILLLDEPFSAADGHTKHILESELIEIIKSNFHKPVLLVTHNIEEAYRLSDRIMIIENGTTVQTASKKEIIDHPKTLNAARITGCKNIFPVDIISSSGKETIIKCNEMTIRAAGKPPKKDNLYIGVRAHYINILPENKSQHNTYPCRIMEVIEGIFSTTVIAECASNIFRAEISKNSSILEICRKNKKLFIHIPSDKIFFTTE